MYEIESKFKNFIRNNQLITDNDKILAAVSGGADSVCMLMLLNELVCACNWDVSLGVVSVNHGFRPEADSEVQYVKKLCDERNIPFYLREIKPGECRNSEEEARIYRYRLIEETAREYGYNKIALAHNLQDRAETVLFNMFRGTGITGLTGIKAVRDIYIRPILWMDRSDIEGYLHSQEIGWCTDASNLGDDYSRNKIRHHILPKAQEINSHTIEHIGETAEHMAEIEEYLKSEAKSKLSEIAEITQKGTILAVDKLKQLHPVIRKEMYRLAIMDMTPHLKDITANHIKSIDSLVNKDVNAQTHLPYGIRIIRAYDQLYIVNGEMDTQVDQSVTIRERVFKAEEVDNPMEMAPRNKYTKWFDYDKINGSYTLRAREESDEIVVDKEGHRKSVNRYMIEQKIPRHLRDDIKMLVTDRDVLWIIGYRDSSAYRVDESTTTIIEITIEMED